MGKRSAVGFEWIGNPCEAEERATRCITNLSGEWEEAWIMDFDRKRLTVELFMPSASSEERGLQILRLPAALVAPFPENPSAELDAPHSPASDLTFEALLEEDDAKKLELLTQATELDPEYWFAQSELALALEAVGNWRGAAACWRRVMRHADASRRADLQFQFASCLDRCHELEEATVSYRACLASDPDHPYARNNLGWCLVRLRRLDEAVKVLGEALEREEDKRYPRWNLARALELLGKYSDAVKVLEPLSDRRGAQKRIAKLRRLAAEARPAAPEIEPVAEAEDEEGGGAGQPDSHLRGDGTEASARQGFVKERHLEAEIEELVYRGIQVFGRRLSVYESEDKTAYGRQFQAGHSKRIDLLLVDERGDFFVVELKRDRQGEAVLEQVAGYVDWVRKHLAKGRSVTGVVCVQEASEGLRRSAKDRGVEVWQYELSFARC